MMDWTDRHCRYFLRGFAPDVLLYTEMITAAAILRGDRARLLRFDPEEHPLALQLGGSEPRELARAARAGEEAGYDEINLNCGCPSERVASGAFGACLMREPARVAECVAAMHAAVRIPVTVKMRIGVISAAGREVRAAVSQYTEEDFAALVHFVGGLRAAGCQVAIVHARQAVLGGLSPKDNREVPPLRYEVVRRLKEQLPRAAGGRQRWAARQGGGARGAQLVRRRNARARGLSPAVRVGRAAACARARRGAGSDACGAHRAHGALLPARARRRRAPRRHHTAHARALQR